MLDIDIVNRISVPNLVNVSHNVMHFQPMQNINKVTRQYPGTDNVSLVLPAECRYELTQSVLLPFLNVRKRLFDIVGVNPQGLDEVIFVEYVPNIAAVGKRQRYEPAGELIK